MQELNLSRTKVGASGANALTRLSELNSLNLGTTSIGDHGAYVVATLKHLTSVNLHGNKISDDGARAIATLPCLRSLDLRTNQISSEGTRALVRLANLKSLLLGANPIGLDGFKLIAGLEHLTSLDLSSTGVGTDGIAIIASLKALNFLGYHGNKIGDEGAAVLSQFQELTSLDLLSSEIGDEGARGISNVPKLRSLQLAGNRIGTEGARAIAGLTHLTSLDLGGSRVGDNGAEAIAKLAQLTSLNLHSNEISASGACALANLQNLVSLHLQKNQIGDDGAECLARLPNIFCLNVGRNGIGNAGARAIASNKNVVDLHLGSNSIGDGGARAVAKMDNVVRLLLDRNDIGNEGAAALLKSWSAREGKTGAAPLTLGGNWRISLLPTEVLKRNDPDALLAAYRSYSEAEADGALERLNEAKLLVVGNEAVGKTSLVRFLVEDRARDVDEKKTLGMVLSERIETQQWAIEHCPVKLNVWDFGGQEIMRGTHRYFLTARSLYLLVLEDRREDDRSIYEWLKLIRHLGGDSPVIVVINKCDDDRRHLRLDEAHLQASHPAIAGFVRTACNDDARSRQLVAELRQQIVNVLTTSSRLEHVRDPIPEPWRRVKDAVREHSRAASILPVSEFERLSREEGVTEPTTQRALLQLLHELGVVVAHGLQDSDAAARREITLLDPNWLTTAIYAVLNSPSLRDRGGELGRTELVDLLNPSAYPPERHEFILDMMQDPQIGLAFRLPGPHERYLVPEALPESAPATKTWPQDALRLRYRYDVLPRALIPRLIVDAHRKLIEGCRWRTGAYFEAAGCKVYVRANRESREIDLAVAGPGNRRRDALNVIVGDLEVVHGWLGEIDAEARVPLPDNSEVDVSYNHLLRLEAMGERTYVPEGASRSYDVTQLLSGVRREPVILGDQHKGDKTEHDTDTPSPSLRPAVVTATAAVVFVLALVVVPIEWRWIMTAAGAAGLAGFGLAQWWQLPIYRRLAAMWCFGGVGVGATGFIAKAGWLSPRLEAFVEWDSALTWPAVVGWAFALGILVLADHWAAKSHPPNRRAS